MLNTCLVMNPRHPWQTLKHTFIMMTMKYNTLCSKTATVTTNFVAQIQIQRIRC